MIYLRYLSKKCQVSFLRKSNNYLINHTKQERENYFSTLSYIHHYHHILKFDEKFIYKLQSKLFSEKNTIPYWRKQQVYLKILNWDGRYIVVNEVADYAMIGKLMQKLHIEFEKALSKKEVDPLILIFVYILEFVRIHPFTDGNGRMSRLLLLFLLYKTGYTVGKYVSLELLLEKTKPYWRMYLAQHKRKWRISNSRKWVEVNLKLLKLAYKQCDCQRKRLLYNK